MKSLFYFVFLSIILIFASCGDPAGEDFGVPKISAGNLYLFPSVILGESEVSNTIDFKNIGTSSLEITSVSFKNGGVEYDISDLKSKLPKKLNPNQKISFFIKFTPSKIKESHADTLVFHLSNNKEAVLKVDAPINRPEISVSPKRLVYAQTHINSFKIRNTGNVPLTITGDLTIEQTGEYFSFDGGKPSAGTKICPSNASEDNQICDGMAKEVTVTVKYSGSSEDEREGRVSIPNDDEDTFVSLTASLNVCSLKLLNISDDTLDFGSTFINEDGTNKTIVLKNVGGEACKLTGLNIEEQSANVFSLVYINGYPEINGETIVGPDEQYAFKVNFKPVDELSYNGKLIISSDDENWTDGKKEITLLGVGTKAVNPIAKCDPEYFEVEPGIDNPNNPLSIITLDGSQSTDPQGGTLTYRWEKIAAPDASQAMPRNPTAAETTYFVDAAGEHKIKLTVTNEAGLSDSCVVTAVGITSNALHVELFWDKNGDVDLHFKKPGTNDEAWGTRNDCYFANCTHRLAPNGLEWGEPGDADNPKLDRDDMFEKGPENLNMDQPTLTNDDEFYVVGVKNYSHTGNPTATVRIYCNGGAQFEYSRSLPQVKSFWWVAGIAWTENGCNITFINNVGNYPGASGR